jgi:hypothetical protein
MLYRIAQPVNPRSPVKNDPPRTSTPTALRVYGLSKPMFLRRMRGRLRLGATCLIAWYSGTCGRRTTIRQ